MVQSKSFRGIWSYHSSGYEVAVFWDMKAWNPTEIQLSFGAISIFSTSPETWVNFYHTTRSHILADNSLQEYIHLSSSPHSAIKIFRLIMPKPDTVVPVTTVRSANKYRNGFNSVDDNVSPTPRPDRPTLGPINPLNAELNPICYLLALLGARHILQVSGLRVNFLIQWNPQVPPGISAAIA
jgi:hypothetical protein